MSKTFTMIFIFELLLGPKSHASTCAQIGAGISGKTVLEISEEKGTKIIVKTYDVLSRLLGDDAIFKELALIYVPFSRSNNSFIIPRYKTNFKERIMTRSYIEGKTLHELLLSDISPTLKQNLKDMYNIRKNYLLNLLEAQKFLIGTRDEDDSEVPAYFSDKKRDGLPVTFIHIPSRSGLSTLILKSDNIIVSPDNDRMYLIDPY